MRDFFVPSIGFPYWQEGLLNAGYFLSHLLGVHTGGRIVECGIFFNPIYLVFILAGKIVECGIFFPIIGFAYWQEGLLNAGYYLSHLLGFHTGRKDC